MPTGIGWTRTRRAATLAAALVGAGVLVGSLGGCVTRVLSREPDAAAQLARAPKVKLDAFEGKHMVVMRAPHAGWNIRLDGTHKTEAGKRVYLTIRRPDPVLMYPQRIVLKRVLTQVDTGTTIDLVARVLDHDEKAKRQEYAPLTPVGSFGE